MTPSITSLASTLAETGLYGNNCTELVLVALYDHCKMLIAGGKSALAPRMPSKEVTDLR